MAQNTMVFEPLQHMLQGVVQGHEIHQQMMNAALAQEAEQRRAYQQERDNKIEDISIQQKLQSSSDPVDAAGMVNGSFEGVDGLVGKFSKDQTYSTKADKSRTVEYGGRQYQLHTPQQQLRDQLSDEKQKKKVENDSMLERFAGEETLRAPYRQAEIDQKGAIDTANNERALEVARINAKAAQDRVAANNKAAQSRTDSANASREKVAKGRLGAEKGATANAIGVQNRQDEKDYNGLQDQESELNGLRTRLGTAIKNGKLFIDEKGKSVPLVDSQGNALPLTDGETADMKARFQSISDQLKTTVKRKNDLIVKKGGKPLVSTEAAHSKIDAGTKSLLGDPAAAAPAKEPAAPAKEAAPAASQYKQDDIVKRKKDGSRFKITSKPGEPLQGEPIP